ncbi:MAG: STAS domain-containing protein [Azospira sp.]|nr:STAS domain-containing protein [Azospira sp.]
MSLFERKGNTLKVMAPMRHDNAPALLAEGRALLASDITEIDLAAVSEADSSALALIFAWLRDARAQGRTLAIRNPPAGLTSLAGVYGVDEFLPLA